MTKAKAAGLPENDPTIPAISGVLSTLMILITRVARETSAIPTIPGMQSVLTASSIPAIPGGSGSFNRLSDALLPAGAFHINERGWLRSLRETETWNSVAEERFLAAHEYERTHRRAATRTRRREWNPSNGFSA